MRRFVVAVLFAASVVWVAAPAQAWSDGRPGRAHAHAHRHRHDPCFKGGYYGFAYATPWFFGGFGYGRSQRHFRRQHRPHHRHGHGHDRHGDGSGHRRGGRRHR